MPELTRQVDRTVWRSGELKTDVDRVVTETAVAFVYNGISHAVMMSTPSDLEDLALGFSLSESILASPDQLLGLDVVEQEQGIELAMEITAEPFAALKHRRRSLAGRSGCGLCGVESLQQLQLPVACVGQASSTTQLALQRALEQLGQSQPLKSLTGGVHAAAWCDPAGDLQFVREDVGRHNALDKLLGALARGGDTNGFAVVTSRASYEMVAKAAACGVEILGAVSAPTNLAIDYAQQSGLTLLGFIQAGRQVLYTHPQRIRE